MDRRRFLAALSGGAGLSSLAATAGCLGVAGGGDYDVGMRASAFDPVEYTVAVGDTVVWKNTSSRAHTVTAYEGGIPDEAAFFASGGFDTEQAARDAWHDDLGGSLQTDDTYSHTFEVPGRYEYFCIPHEKGGMIGRVFVEE